MLLAIDIGNTAIKFGIFDGDRLNSKFIVPTRRDYSVDELREAVKGQLDGGFKNVIVSSVVPEVNKTITKYLSHFRNAKPRFIKTTDDFDLTFSYAINEAGTDRLVNSFAAAEKYGVPVVVIGFGTATTIDVIDRSREHRGGLIALGPAATARALQLFASKLPDVEIAEPPNVISTTTITSIQSGIFYSQVGLVETAIPDIKAEIGGDARVIATGGFAHLIAHKCRSVDVVDGDLTLEGLRMLYSRRLAV